MDDSKNPIANRWQRQPPLKTNFYLSVLQIKGSSTCLITASLCEGPFFYFYVESPPSTFMHRLWEHSYHSEYNVHCPKVFIDWFMTMVSLVLKLFVSSCPLKLEGVLYIYVLLSIKDKLKTICMFFLMIWTHVWLLLFHFHNLLFMFIFMFITWSLSFYYQDYVFHAHVLSSFDPSS
jgi:hypothetical protein